MVRHTTANKFFLYRKMNQVFLKWRFFYNRYVSKIAFFKDGFYLEDPVSITQPTVKRTKDLTKMVFWLLDLTEIGYSNKLTQDKRNINFEWELVKGESQFIEAYGAIDYTGNYKTNYHLFEEKIKSSIISFFWENHDVLLMDSDIKSISLDSVSHSKKKFLKVSVLNKFNKKLEAEPLDNNVHSYYKKDMSLWRDKNPSLDFEPAVDYSRLNLLRNFSEITPYDEIDLYTNMFGYTKNTGVSGVDLFKKLIKTGHQNGRFKMLPTYVANYDDPDLLIPGLGFHNYLKVTDNDELTILKLFTRYSKTFMPADGLNEISIFFDDFPDKTLFYNYYERNSKCSFFHEGVYNDNAVDYVMYNFSNKNMFHFSDKEIDIFNNLYEGSSKSFSSLYLMFVKLYSDILFSQFHKNILHAYLMQNVFNRRENNFPLIYDNYQSLNLMMENLLNFLDRKTNFFGHHYTRLHTMHDVYLHKWNDKLKQLFLLKVDLRSNWGHYFDVPHQVDQEEIKSKKAIPYTMSHAYKSYFEIVRYPTIIELAKRPYKWISIPLLQHSPFFYWLNNVRSNWFNIFDQILGIFGALKKDRLSKYDLETEKVFVDWMSRLFFSRYFYKNDFYYNNILKYMLSNSFLKIFFGEDRKDYLGLTLFLDSSLSQLEIDKNIDINGKRKGFVEELVIHTNNILPQHFYKDAPGMNIYSLLKYSGYFKYGSSGFFEADWQTDYRNSNLTRVPLLTKIGTTPEHFSFFSFFSRDFFEQAVAYKSWMKFRTFETPYMEEKTWREFTYLHQPLIDLTTDITLSKYKADLLNLLELGFHDIVFEKEIFYKTHYLSQPLKLRDVFEFQEFTAPFFFFDSERGVFGNVPKGLPFEYVSSFGIPLLDKRWMVADVLGPNVLRKMDRGEWYMRSESVSSKDFKQTWRKDRMVHKLIHHNDYYAIELKNNMRLSILTSIKGSKIYDFDPKVNKHKQTFKKPKVVGVLHRSVLIVNQDQQIDIKYEKDKEKEHIYLSQYKTLYKQYIKSFFFILLKQSFKTTPCSIQNFVNGLQPALIHGGVKLGDIEKVLWNSLKFFADIYLLLENFIRYLQINFILFFKQKPVKSLLDTLIQLVVYLRLLIFLFKHKS